MRCGFARTSLGCTLLALCSACGTTTPDVVPFRGPVPRSVLVVPAVGPGGMAMPELDEALVEMLRAHGFEVESAERGADWLVGAGWQPGRARVEELPFTALLTTRGVDALCVTEITTWQLETRSGYPFVFDLSCALYATRDRATLWRARLEGEEPTAQRRTVFDPYADRDPFESDNPFAWKSITEVLSDREIMTLVARGIGVRMPNS